MSSGTTNGAGQAQCAFLRAPATSSAPCGSPCALGVPALVGAPKPMVVLQAISVGLSDFCAAWIAAAIAFGIVAVDVLGVPAGGLEARDLVEMSASDSGPSMEMPLSSQRTISLLSLRWPASRSPPG